MSVNRSVATIDAPQFINLRENALNPGISECEIKVFYLGHNRNKSYIDRNTAIQMANSLPGTPIVAAWREDIDDFGDHGHVMHIEDGEVTFSCKTMPYGFVSPDAQVWFKTFDEYDEFGNAVEREYLMTTGYLWTSQYPEVTAALEGKGQSMELDPDHMEGHWAEDSSKGVEFFIINDAVFSKLCILGDDVEPCFEGASVSSPEVSREFSYGDFSRTLFSMMRELKNALQNEGNSSMTIKDDFACGGSDKKKYEDSEDKKNVSESVASDVEKEKEEEKADPAEDEKKKASENALSEDGAEVETEHVASDDKKEEEGKALAEDGDEAPADEDEEKKKAASEHSLEDLGAQLEQMRTAYAAMEKEVEELRSYKREQEDRKKMGLVDKYFMLSDEDKADIVAHISEYTYDEIESKLALLYVHKNVDFTTVDGRADEEAEEDSLSVTFSLDDPASDSVPPMVQALREAKNL